MNVVSGVPGVDFTVEDVRPEFLQELEIAPLAGPPEATVRVPGSKSITNRALIIAALANGASTIRNPLFADDPYWLMEALVRLGIDVVADAGRSEVHVKGRCGEIPAADLVDAMRQLGAPVGYAGEEGRFPLMIEGGGIPGGEARVSGGKSSQFVSGLLLAAPYATRRVTLLAEGRKEWPYVGITAALMRKFGVGVDTARGRFAVAPTIYRARDFEVEPDA